MIEIKLLLYKPELKATSTLKKKKSLIVKGVLHAEKNKVKKNEVLEDIPLSTNGVPVVQEICDDNTCVIEQHSEVEKNELILHPDIYKKALSLQDNPLVLGKFLANHLINELK